MRSETAATLGYERGWRTGPVRWDIARRSMFEFADTPVHSILFTGFWRWGFLTVIWAIAITGMTLKSIFFNEQAEWVGLVTYLGLGWLGILSAYLTYRLHGFTIIKPLLFGALSYTAGASLEFLQLPVVITGVIGPHELFHIAVLAGLAWHWQFVRNLLLMRQKTKQDVTT